MSIPRRFPWIEASVALLLCLMTTLPVGAARRQSLALVRTSISLPGMPAKLLTPDLDGDGRRDVLAVVVFDEVDTIVEERVEDLIPVTTVIPAVLERRELRAWITDSTGALQPAGSVPLPTSVLALDLVDDGARVVALTDDGVSWLRWSGTGQGPSFEPWIVDRTVFAGSEGFIARFDWVEDLDGDGREELIVPALDGLAIYDGRARDSEDPPTARRVTLPGDRVRDTGSVRREYPWPQRADVDGDGQTDLIIVGGLVHLLLARGDRFVPPYDEPDECSGTRTALRRRTADGSVVPVAWQVDLQHLGDLDGAGAAEAVFVETRLRGEGLRAGMKDAKRPQLVYAVHRLGDDLVIEAEPSQRFDVIGHGFDIPAGSGPASLSRFEDLDGDGRSELIAFTLDFSMFQALRVLATKKIGIGIEFHVWTQDDQGQFRKVENLDLSEKLRFDLRQLELGRFAQFAGDFDGDGRRDFVHVGRGSSVTIHRGAPGCRYPEKPDLVLELDDAPQHVGLVRIEDLDGDGRSDLALTRILSGDEREQGDPVVVDLYLSGHAP